MKEEMATMRGMIETLTREFREFRQQSEQGVPDHVQKREVPGGGGR